MTRISALVVLVGFVGLTLVLSELRWFRRVELAERLDPYVPGARTGRTGLLSVASFRDVIAPLARVIGDNASRLFGMSEDLGTRLERIHSPVGVTEFRVRQIGWSAVGFGASVLIAVGTSAPVPFALVLVVGGPLLMFLLLEQRLAAASADWQRRIFLELPVITEQLGMLMSAGWSLGASLGRVAERGEGACATDLERVRTRMRQGLTDVEALREWATLADVDELDGLVSVLALNRDAGDLGRLISEEARSIRRQAQRHLIESLERRTEQVWIPVTVAALLPGVLLLGVPFFDALSLFTS